MIEQCLIDSEHWFSGRKYMYGHIIHSRMLLSFGGGGGKTMSIFDHDYATTMVEFSIGHCFSRSLRTKDYFEYFLNLIVHISSKGALIAIEFLRLCTASAGTSVIYIHEMEGTCLRILRSCNCFYEELDYSKDADACNLKSATVFASTTYHSHCLYRNPYLMPLPDRRCDRL